MKNKRIFKTFSALCAALVLMMGLSVTAFAQGTDQPPAEDATNDANVVVEENLRVYQGLRSDELVTETFQGVIDYG